MRVVLVEHDHLQANTLMAELRCQFDRLDVVHFDTAAALCGELPKLGVSPPDVIILDVMLRWTNPGPNMQLPPKEFRNAGPYRTGLECLKLLLRDPRTASVPVIVHSVVDRSSLDLEAATLPGNVLFVSKGMDRNLARAIRSLLHATGRSTEARQKVFLVHGRDALAKETVARFIERLGVEPVILQEELNRGQTIIEKFEANSHVSFAVVLFTPDDKGGLAKPGRRLTGRARQNVVLELGFFIAKLGRERVCVLYKEGAELPSDYHGVLYVNLDDGGAWKARLAKEMASAGVTVQLDRAL